MLHRVTLVSVNEFSSSAVLCVLRGEILCVVYLSDQRLFETIEKVVEVFLVVAAGI